MDNSTIVGGNTNGLNNNRNVTLKNKRRTEFNEKFGWSASCSPRFLQCFANKHAFLIIFSLTCILQGTFRTYFVAVITTIEKLFSLPSQTTGLLLSATEIGQVSSALILPYYAGQGHRPRWMGIGAGLFSLAVLFCASPHWLLPPSPKLISYDETDVNYNNATNNHELCTSETAIFSCSANSDDGQQKVSKDGNYYIYSILFLSLLSVGLGQTAVNLLGIPYLDDNVENKDSPMYFSVTIGVRILGPVAGFVLGALCTKLYIYPTIDPYPLTPNNPRWLGAWWLGMLIIGSLLLLISVLLFAFPAQLSQKSIQKQPRPKMKNFPRTLKRLLSNKILCLRTFSSVFHLLPISGLYTFLPKYLESQYKMAAHEANLYTGIAGILVMGIGIFASGFIIRVYGRNFGAKGIALWIGASALIYSLGMLLLVWVGGCDEVNDVSDVITAGGFNLSTPHCSNATCVSCSPTNYSPVCSLSTQETYFSPCHAGCSSVSQLNNTLQFEDCACINDPIQTVKLQPCPSTCSKSNFILYLFIFMTIVLVHSTSEVGSMLLTLRCVEKRDKAMALGLVQFAIGLFGNVPCPIVYGLVIDSSCKVWGGTCGDGGHCWLYDTKEFRQYFHGLTAALMSIAFIIDFVIYFYANQIRLDEDQGGEETVQGRRIPPPVEMEPLNQKL